MNLLLCANLDLGVWVKQQIRSLDLTVLIRPMHKKVKNKHEEAYAKSEMRRTEYKFIGSQKSLEISG